MKTTTWEIHSRNINHPAKLEHLWWRVIHGVRSLEEAKEQLNIEKRSDRDSREFKIVRVEKTVQEFDETVWQGIKTPYIIAMTTQIDLSPYWNEYSNEWEVSETDERGNTLEVYGFSTEDAALNFINEWIEKNNLTPA